MPAIVHMQISALALPSSPWCLVALAAVLFATASVVHILTRRKKRAGDQQGGPLECLHDFLAENDQLHISIAVPLEPAPPNTLTTKTTAGRGILQNPIQPDTATDTQHSNKICVADKEQSAKQKRSCRYFGTTGGCWKGASCPFQHTSNSEVLQASA